MPFYDDPFNPSPAPTLLGLLQNDDQINQAKNLAEEKWNEMNLLQQASLVTNPLPIIPDALGLLGDGYMYLSDPETRNIMNYGQTALGLLPFVPNIHAQQ